MQISVPFIKQVDNNSCGAAVLQMIYKYYDIVFISQQEIMEQYRELEPYGSGNYRIQTETLVTDANKMGLNASWDRVDYTNNSECVKTIKSFLEEKVPLIVCQKLNNKYPAIGHFRIIVGIDDNHIYYHDPYFVDGANVKCKIDKFLGLWEHTGQNVTGGVYCSMRR